METGQVEISKGTHKNTQALPNALLVNARQAAAMCGKSLRTWRSWDAAGWIPRPVRIGRSTLWRLAELNQWIAAGCPRRLAWEARMERPSASAAGSSGRRAASP